MACRWCRAALAAGLAWIVVQGTALAHHSFAMFDHTRSVTLVGVVTKYQWTNPHGYIELDVDDGKGGKVHYTLELTSINMLTRAGWTSRTVKPGDKVTVVAAPLLDGSPGGLLLEITLPDGKKMSPPVPNIESFKRTS